MREEKKKTFTYSHQGVAGAVFFFHSNSWWRSQTNEVACNVLKMPVGTDTLISWMQSIFLSKTKYWYVPIQVKAGGKKGRVGAGDVGVEDEEIDFIEVDKGVTVAFDDIKRAKLACANEGWPGLLELGPKKWKSFLVQRDARPEQILKNPTQLCKPIAKPRCQPSKRTINAFGFLALLVLAWFTLGDNFVGPITLCLTLLGKIVSPILQFLLFFIMFVCSLVFVGVGHCTSCLITFALTFTAMEIYNMFDDDVFIINIDHMALRKLAED